jgi:hypothetical protein
MTVCKKNPFPERGKTFQEPVQGSLDVDSGVLCSRNYAVEVLDGAVSSSGHVADNVRQS